MRDYKHDIYKTACLTFVLLVTVTETEGVFSRNKHGFTKDSHPMLASLFKTMDNVNRGLGTAGSTVGDFPTSGDANKDGHPDVSFTQKKPLISSKPVPGDTAQPSITGHLGSALCAFCQGSLNETCMAIHCLRTAVASNSMGKQQIHKSSDAVMRKIPAHVSKTGMSGGHDILSTGTGTSSAGNMFGNPKTEIRSHESPFIPQITDNIKNVQSPIVQNQHKASELASNLFNIASGPSTKENTKQLDLAGPITDSQQRPIHGTATNIQHVPNINNGNIPFVPNLIPPKGLPVNVNSMANRNIIGPIDNVKIMHDVQLDNVKANNNQPKISPPSHQPSNNNLQGVLNSVNNLLLAKPTVGERITPRQDDFQINVNAIKNQNIGDVVHQQDPGVNIDKQAMIPTPGFIPDLRNADSGWNSMSTDSAVKGSHNQQPVSNIPEMLPGKDPRSIDASPINFNFQSNEADTLFNWTDTPKVSDPLNRANIRPLDARDIDQQTGQTSNTQHSGQHLPDVLKTVNSLMLGNPVKNSQPINPTIDKQPPFISPFQTIPEETFLKTDFNIEDTRQNSANIAGDKSQNADNTASVIPNPQTRNSDGQPIKDTGTKKATPQTNVNIDNEKNPQESNANVHQQSHAIADEIHQLLSLPATLSKAEIANSPNNLNIAPETLPAQNPVQTDVSTVGNDQNVDSVVAGHGINDNNQNMNQHPSIQGMMANENITFEQPVESNPAENFIQQIDKNTPWFVQGRNPSANFGPSNFFEPRFQNVPAARMPIDLSNEGINVFPSGISNPQPINAEGQQFVHVTSAESQVNNVPMARNVMLPAQGSTAPTGRELEANVPAAGDPMLPTQGWDNSAPTGRAFEANVPAAGDPMLPTQRWDNSAPTGRALEANVPAAGDPMLPTQGWDNSAPTGRAFEANVPAAGDPMLPVQGMDHSAPRESALEENVPNVGTPPTTTPIIQTMRPARKVQLQAFASKILSGLRI